MPEIMKYELPVLNLLRQVFLTEPTEELLAGIGKIEVPPGEGKSPGLELMISSVKGNESRLGEWQEDLAAEFARLFLGPAHPPAMPFASFYLSESQQLMAEETLEVRKRYLEASLAAKDLHRIPDDHIGIELDFLSYLTSRYLELGLQEGNKNEAERFLKMRRNFLTDHFILWAPRFADRVLESTQEDFFRGAATLLKEIVEYYKVPFQM